MYLESNKKTIISNKTRKKAFFRKTRPKSQCKRTIVPLFSPIFLIKSGVFLKEKVKCVAKKHLSESDHDSDEAEDEYAEPVQPAKKDKAFARTSVSAEVYGKFNKPENFKPKVVPKTQAQKDKIAMRLNQAFMFSNLDEKEKEIVINAMEEVKYK